MLCCSVPDLMLAKFQAHGKLSYEPKKKKKNRLDEQMVICSILLLLLSSYTITTNKRFKAGLFLMIKKKKLACSWLIKN
jgi:predicted nucleic acid-binding protein